MAPTEGRSLGLNGSGAAAAVPPYIREKRKIFFTVANRNIKRMLCLCASINSWSVTGHTSTVLPMFVLHLTGSIKISQSVLLASTLKNTAAAE